MSYSVVEGPAFLREHVLEPIGTGTVRVRMSQPGDDIFLPAPPVEQIIAVDAKVPRPFAANTPSMSLKLYEEIPRWAKAIAFQPDGKVIVGGAFKEVGGVGRTNIARFNADGTLDETWHPSVFGQEVTSLIVRGDAVYVGGLFYEVNGYPVSHLARISLTNAGTLDPTWDYRPQGQITKMIEYENWIILVGGFQGISGHSKSFLAKIPFDGGGTPSVDPFWNPAPNQSVTDAALYGTNLFIGGYFTEVAGLPIAHLAKVSASGRGDADPNWKVPFGQPAWIQSLVVTDEGLFAAGNMSLDSGQQPAYFSLVQFSRSDGQVLATRYQNMPVTTLAADGPYLYTAFGHHPDPAFGSPYVLRLNRATLQPDPDWHVKSSRRFLQIGGTFGSTLGIGGLVFHRGDLWALGLFASLSGSSSAGVTLLPTFEGPPVAIGTTVAAGFQSSTGLVFFPYPNDRIETTHYRISGIQNGILLKRDGTTPVANGGFVTRAEAAAGLKFRPESGFSGTVEIEVQPASQDQDFAVAAPGAIAQISVLPQRLSQTIDYAPLTDVPFNVGSVNLNFSASSGLPVTFTVTGPARLNGGRLEITGLGPITITAEQVGNEIYAPVTQSVSFTATKAAQQITFQPLGPARFGSSQLLVASSSSGLPVTFSIATGAATIRTNVITFEGLGRMTILATQLGNDLFEPAQVTQEVTVLRGLQTIELPALTPRPYDGLPITLPLTASSGLPVSYRVLNGPGIVQQNILTPQAPGVIRVEAFQAGNDLYEPLLIEQFVTIQKRNQVIDFPPIAAPAFTNRTSLTNATIQLVASASSGLPVHFWVQSGAAQILRDGARYLLSFARPGTVLINAQQIGTDIYEPSLVATQSVVIEKIPQTIDFRILPDARFDSVPIALGGTASSGLPVQFAVVSGPGLVRTNHLVLTGLGTILVAAEQTGDDFYAPASVTNVMTVFKGNQTISFPLPATAPVVDNLRLDAAASSELPVSFSIVSGPASLISSNLVRFQSTGTVSIAASQAGNSLYEAAAPVVRSITVVRAQQTIVFPTILDRPWNESPALLRATNSSGLPVTYELVSGPATLSSNLLHLVGAGTVAIRGFHSGTDLFEPAETIQTFTARPIAQAINFSVLPDIRLSDGPRSLQATASSGLPVQFSVSGPGLLDTNRSEIVPQGVGVIRVLARQPGNSNYLSAEPVERAFNVLKGIQTIQFLPAGPAQVNVPLDLQATTSSGLPVQFGVVSGAGIIGGNRLTPVAVGDIVVLAFQLGNENYEAAPPVQQTISVVRGDPSLRVTRVGPTLFLRWDSFFSEYRLEESASLTAPVWTTVSGIPSIDNGIATFSVPINNATRFYRLRQ